MLLAAVLAGVVISLVIGLTCWVVRRSRRGARRPELLGIDPADIADLQARFARVDAEEGRGCDRRLAVRLSPLVERRVPARCVVAAPGRRAARVRFADGTTVVVRGASPGDVGVLASWVRGRSVLPTHCSTDADGTHLVFGSLGGHRTLSVLVTGFDQPD